MRDGLIFDIFLDEWDESEARGWKNLFASILSFSSKSEVKRPSLVQKIESEEDMAEFQQIYRLNNSIPPESKIVDVEFFKGLNDALTTMYEEDRAAFRELGRAFMYYRKSLGEMKMEDRFTDLYIVLDALMMKLRDHYISKEGLDGSQDKKFGLRELFDGFSENDFDEDVYEARCELFHEGKKQKAIEMVEDVEEAVERGICLLLDINYDHYEQILSQKPGRVGKRPCIATSS